MQEKETPKITDPKTALIKAQKYCAYQERSQQEVRDKLYSYGLHRNQVEPIIAELISSGFLKEERFAIAFAGGKFRMKAWGKIKIKQALKFKSVPDKIISKALSEIDDRDYEKALKKLIMQQRTKAVKERNPMKKNYKIAQYAISRGFEPELVWSLLKSGRLMRLKFKVLFQSTIPSHLIELLFITSVFIFLFLESYATCL